MLSNEITNNFRPPFFCSYDCQVVKEDTNFSQRSIPREKQKSEKENDLTENRLKYIVLRQL